MAAYLVWRLRDHVRVLSLAKYFSFFLAKADNWITPFHIHEEIEQDKVAAGIAIGGVVLANGIVLMQAFSGTLGSLGRKPLPYTDPTPGSPLAIQQMHKCKNWYQHRDIQDRGLLT